MNSTLVFLSLLAIVSANPSSFQVLRKFYSRCTNQTEIFKCLKIQSLKIVDRALHSHAIQIMDGVTLIGDRQSRSLVPLNGSKLDKLSSEEVDDMLKDTTARFWNSRKLEVRLPTVLEARKKGKGGGWAALLWALAIKGSFLALAYQGIAVMSGTSIIVGKMALLLSAILGLKKLVSSNQEKTTFEIVKVPKHSETHSHSTSYEDDDHYHRYDSFGRRMGYNP